MNTDEPSLPTIPTIRLLGPSGSGKTTLGERLVRSLTERGYRVATIKNALKHPQPEDLPGSDTQRYREAGVVVGAGRFQDGAVLTLPDADLGTLQAMIMPVADLLLVEGFHEAALPTLVFQVEGMSRYDGGDQVIATIVSEVAAAEPPAVIHRDDVAAVVEAVTRWLDS